MPAIALTIKAILGHVAASLQHCVSTLYIDIPLTGSALNMGPHPQTGHKWATTHRIVRGAR